MGSYDTDEYRAPSRSSTSDSGSSGSNYTPRRATPRSRPSESVERDLGTVISGITGERNSSETSSASSSSPTPDTSPGYDTSVKTIVALGGGLTPDRIVHPIPSNLRTINEVIGYLKSPEVAQTSDERAIVEAINSRMGRSDYMVILNQSMNYGNSRLNDGIGSYLERKSHNLEDGTTMPFNYLDVAIVSHDEGGIKKMYGGLEKRL